MAEDPRPPRSHVFGTAASRANGPGGAARTRRPDGGLASATTAAPELRIHADESCLGNQFAGRRRPGGAGALVEAWTGDHWTRQDLWLSSPDTTNNRMALAIAIRLLETLGRPSRAVFVSDSQYLVKGASQWMQAWKRKGWKRKGGPIENVEMWRRLDAALAKHEVRWEWVRGHAGNPRNEYADHLATRAAREQYASSGLVPSAFPDWLEEQRGTRGRFLDFCERAPPN